MNAALSPLLLSFPTGALETDNSCEPVWGLVHCESRRTVLLYDAEARAR
jgi:hypothetical protein